MEHLKSINNISRRPLEIVYKMARPTCLSRLLLVSVLCCAIHVIFHMVIAPFLRKSVSSTISLPSLSRKVSVIIPTYKEVLNLKKLIPAIFNETRKVNIDAEVLIVDDNSGDGSVELVEELKKNSDIDVRIIIRTKERGLASAVLHGFQFAKHPILVVMDADLSHPPSLIGAVAEPVILGEADFSIASRYVKGGKTVNWPFSRRLTSRFASFLARPLVPVHDPMSGFFSLRQATYKFGKNINQVGFKIGLELMVKCKPKRIVEIPYVFVDREYGKSKLNFKTKVEYLKQLANLFPFVYSLKKIFFTTFLPIFLGIYLYIY